MVRVDPGLNLPVFALIHIGTKPSFLPFNCATWSDILSAASYVKFTLPYFQLASKIKNKYCTIYKNTASYILMHVRLIYFVKKYFEHFKKNKRFVEVVIKLGEFLGLILPQ